MYISIWNYFEDFYLQNSGKVTKRILQNDHEHSSHRCVIALPTRQNEDRDTFYNAVSILANPSYSQTVCQYRNIVFIKVYEQVVANY